MTNEELKVYEKRFIEATDAFADPLEVFDADDTITVVGSGELRVTIDRHDVVFFHECGESMDFTPRELEIILDIQKGMTSET